MTDFDFKAHIARLSAISGISGREEATANYLKTEFDKVCDRTEIDRMGNLIACLDAARADAPTILIDCHSDEIGFLVTEHLEGGFLKLARVGGMDPGVLPASEILLYGKQTVRAVVAAKPPHLMGEEDRKKKPRLEDLYVDTLLSEEEAKELCPRGTPAGFSEGACPLLGGKLVARGLDDRVAALTLLALASSLERGKLAANVLFLCSVQEEVGGMGAMTAAFSKQPDVCLAVDVSFAAFPGQNGRLLEMGKGAGISFSDTLSRSLSADLIRVAKEEKIPHQVLAEPGETGTNAHEIQVAGRGIPSTIVSLPLSYMHSPSEVIDTHDLSLSVDLMRAYCYKARFFPKEVQIVG